MLVVHKDTLSKMATRVDVGGGYNELRSADICAAHYPACQEHPGDAGYPGAPCTRREPFKSIPMGVSSISPAHLHVRCTPHVGPQYV